MGNNFELENPRSLLSTLQAEIKSAWLFIGDSLFRSRIGYCPDSKGNVIIYPGVFGPNIMYLSLINFCHSVGYQGTIENYRMDLMNYTRPSEKSFELAKSFEEKHGKIDYMIGHSLGGLEAVAMLPYFPHVKKVIALASPFNGGMPWNSVKFGEGFIIVPEPVRKRVIIDIVNKGREFADKIVTVSTPLDRLCPPSHSAFPSSKATNIVIYKRNYINDFPEDEEYMTHVGLPNSRYVRERIIRPLLNGKKTSF